MRSRNRVGHNLSDSVNIEAAGQTYLSVLTNSSAKRFDGDVALIADSGALYAIYDAGDKHHKAVANVLKAELGPIIVPAVILAEIDYLLREHLGIDAELDFIHDLSRGVYGLEPPAKDDLVRCRELIDEYRNLDLGLVDAAVIATAERLRISRLLTVDERDFRVVQSKMRRPFTLLPGDFSQHR
jgi:predicted nucleic acid-binding protein